MAFEFHKKLKFVDWGRLLGTPLGTSNLGYTPRVTSGAVYTHFSIPSNRLLELAWSIARVI